MIRDLFPPHGSPCDKCGVRPDVACVHRAADASYHPPHQADETDRRKLQRDQGGFAGHRTIISGGGAYRISAARAAGLLGEPFSPATTKGDGR